MPVGIKCAGTWWHQPGQSSSSTTPAWINHIRPIQVVFTVHYKANFRSPCFIALLQATLRGTVVNPKLPLSRFLTSCPKSCYSHLIRVRITTTQASLNVLNKLTYSMSAALGPAGLICQIGFNIVGGLLSPSLLTLLQTRSIQNRQINRDTTSLVIM